MTNALVHNISVKESTGIQWVNWKNMICLYSRGQYRVVYITPEFATAAQSLLKDLDDQVGKFLICFRVFRSSRGKKLTQFTEEGLVLIYLKKSEIY